MLVIITGTERLLMDQKLEALKKEYPLEVEDLNYIQIDCREVSCRDLIQEVTGVPFFSDYRMVVLKHPYFLTTEKGKSEKDEDIEAFIEALSQTDKSMIVVIFAEGKLDERKKIVKNLRKVADSFDFGKLDANRLRTSTRQAFKKREATIDEKALDLLLERVGDSLMAVQNEVNKLCLYTHHVTLEDVSQLVSKPLEENAFELTSALLQNDFAKIMAIYQDLRQKKEEPVRLIALMASSLRVLYQVKLLDRKGYNDQEISRYLDMNPRRLYYIRKDTLHFELDNILEMIAKLSHLDVAIKQGKVDKYQGLELFFLDLVKK